MTQTITDGRQISYATETEEGVVNKATDAEVIAWAEDTKYVTSKQLKENTSNVYSFSAGNFQITNWNTRYLPYTWMGVPEVFQERQQMVTAVAWTIKNLTVYSFENTISWPNDTNVLVNVNINWVPAITVTIPQYTVWLVINSIDTASVSVWDLLSIEVTVWWDGWDTKFSGSFELV